MASGSPRKVRRDDISSGRHFNNMDDGNAAKVDRNNPRMSLTRKLMMCAELTGMEAAINFEQIYIIPLLQILGMPVSLSYIIGLVSGPSSLLLLSLLGWLIDRGRNPQKRKFVSIVVAASVQVLGVMCLLWANALHLAYLLDVKPNNTQINTGVGMYMDDLGSSDVDTDFLARMFEKNASWFDLKPNSSADSDGGVNLTTSGFSEVNSVDSRGVPFKAGLGMLGFVLIDLGFDLSNCFVKAFMVTCCARVEHTSLMVLAVAMGSVGATTNSVLGLVDFTALLQLNSVEGAKLTIQTSVQGLIVIVILITGLLFTFCTGQKQLRDLRESSSGRNETTCKIPPDSCTSNRSETGALPCTENSVSFYDENTESRNSQAVVFENNIRSFERSGIHVDRSTTVREENPPSLAEDSPLLEDSLHEQEAGDQVTPCYVGSYGAVESAPHPDEETLLVGKSVEDAVGSKPEEGERGRLSCLQNPKVRIFLVCLTTFFATDALLMFTASVSDFLGKGVYGGDPAAQPGSPSLISYQEGVTMASWVFLVTAVTYLFTSIVHPTMLALLGFRVEFTLLQILLTITFLVTALTSRLEVVFVLSVVAGMYRSCYYSMPYAVTNDIAQTIVGTRSGRSPVSLALSLVAAAIPLSYCALFTWVGAVEELTGDASAPLWLGSAAGLMSVAVFLLVGRV